MFVLVGRAAILDIAGGSDPKLVGQWFTWYQGAVMLGALLALLLVTPGGFRSVWALLGRGALCRRHHQAPHFRMFRLQIDRQIEIAQHFDRQCPDIGGIVMYGVSMGGNMTGLGVAATRAITAAAQPPVATTLAPRAAKTMLRAAPPLPSGPQMGSRSRCPGPQAPSARRPACAREGADDGRVRLPRLDRAAGHGGERGPGSERLLEVDDVEALQGQDLADVAGEGGGEGEAAEGRRRRRSVTSGCPWRRSALPQSRPHERRGHVLGARDLSKPVLRMDANLEGRVEELLRISLAIPHHRGHRISGGHGVDARQQRRHGGSDDGILVDVEAEDHIARGDRRRIVPAQPQSFKGTADLDSW